MPQFHPLGEFFEDNVRRFDSVDGELLRFAPADHRRFTLS
jgi:hypothetical protein